MAKCKEHDWKIEQVFHVDLRAVRKYVCTKCGHEFEQFQSMTEDHLKKCPKCKKDALKRKIGTGAGIIFKGAGFYCNDYHAATNEVKAK